MLSPDDVGLLVGLAVVLPPAFLVLYWFFRLLGAFARRCPPPALGGAFLFFYFLENPATYVALRILQGRAQRRAAPPRPR